MMRQIIYFLFTLAFPLGCSGQDTAAQEPPYPPSPMIESITWDFDNLVRMAPGSDLWPVTWAADGHLYTSWGDGGGFGGTNTDGRVSLGFARIEGAPQSFMGYNVWGGKELENPATFGGKSMGMLSVDGILYAWINMQNGDPPDFQLLWSEDLGAHWQRADWVFAGDTAAELTFLNFGQDYVGARDDYVYMYHIRRGSLTNAWLVRVPKNQILDRSMYEWFAGLDGTGDPMWTSNVAQRAPVFEDPSGVGISSVSYNPGIDRYLLTTAHGAYEDGVRKLGIFDAAEPWGPWTTVAYYQDWGGFSGYWLGYYIPTKTPGWMSADGRTIHLLFSGDNELDSFNLVKGTLGLKSSPPPPVDFCCYVHLPVLLGSSSEPVVDPNELFTDITVKNKGFPAGTVTLCGDAMPPMAYAASNYSVIAIPTVLNQRSVRAIPDRP